MKENSGGFLNQTRRRGLGPCPSSDSALATGGAGRPESSFPRGALQGGQWGWGQRGLCSPGHRWSSPGGQTDFPVVYPSAGLGCGQRRASRLEARFFPDPQTQTGPSLSQESARLGEKKRQKTARQSAQLPGPDRPRGVGPRLSPHWIPPHRPLRHATK